MINEPEPEPEPEPVDEELLLPGDRLTRFHPTRPGQVLDGRFKTIAKLGYGVLSTVWLAENVALSVLPSLLLLARPVSPH